MKIKQLMINHQTNPIGYYANEYNASYIIEDTISTKIKSSIYEIALDLQFKNIIYQSENAYHPSTNFIFPIHFENQKRYYWRVKVWGNKGDTCISDTAYFETCKKDTWDAQWIFSPQYQKHAIFHKNFVIEEINNSRLYLSALGLYEVYINHQKVSEYFLTPGYTNYHDWIQYQTYDIEKYLMIGENHIQIVVGPGWYCGRFGFDPLTIGKREQNFKEIYGATVACICEIYNNECLIVKTDETWKYSQSKIMDSSIYDGEIINDLINVDFSHHVSLYTNNHFLIPQIGPYVKVIEKIKPQKIIYTSKKEVILDFGQNFTGYVAFYNQYPKGRKLRYAFSEILNEGTFYQGNLGSAKQEFIYISNGQEKWIRPHFTYFGGRYVLLEGFDNINVDMFEGCCLSSQMERTGFIETSHEKVNKLIQNILWSQKDNFVDIPTDCPLRSERLGWTGDAMIFIQSACYNMNTYCFYKKYLFDLYTEQKRLHGAVPLVVPIGVTSAISSSGWGDAATFMPWILYKHYGDIQILKQQYQSMKDWVNYIIEQNQKNDCHYLWESGFHFGDWVALDNYQKDVPFGGTDEKYIASCFYYASLCIMEKVAHILHQGEDENDYRNLAHKVKSTIVHEYFTPSGRLALSTQTGYILALYFNLVPEEYIERVKDDFIKQIHKDRDHLTTGFLGTPFLNKVLTDIGANELSYKIFLNEDYPSWLYAINLDATTVWERWDSVGKNGMISQQGMNSLNHYSYGSVIGWLYSRVLGIRCVEENPGFKECLIYPRPSRQLQYVKGEYKSINGAIKVSWQYIDDDILYDIVIPIDVSTTIKLEKPHSLSCINGINITHFPSIIKSDFIEIKYNF